MIAVSRTTMNCAMTSCRPKVVPVKLGRASAKLDRPKYLENTAGLALHRRQGFRTIGGRERIGRHHGTWRDVILTERRSPHILTQ